MKTLIKKVLLFAGIFEVVVALCGCASNSSKQPIANPAGNVATVGCQYEGIIFSEGAVVGQAGSVFICKDGDWQRTMRVCDPDVTILFQGKAVVGNRVLSVAEGQNPIAISAYRPRYLLFFFGGPSQLGIKNMTSRCMVAVYVWNPSNGAPIIRHYSVEANSQINVEREGVSGQCIAEIPCETPRQ